MLNGSKYVYMSFQIAEMNYVTETKLRKEKKQPINIDIHSLNLWISVSLNSDVGFALF